MATKKRQIAFYADDVVADWYASLVPGEGTRRINDYLHQAIEHEKTGEDQSRAIVELAAINLTVIQLLQASFKNAGGHSKDLEVLKDLEGRADKLLTFDL